MSDASAAGGGAAAPATAPEGQAPQAAATVDDFLEIDHEIEPGKIAKIKLARSKVAPQLDKWRGDLDRRASKLDLDSKAFTERSTKLEAVLQAARSGPDGTAELLRALGVDPEGFSEAQIAKKVKAIMQADEEKNDPAKKTAREREEKLSKLEKESEERKKTDAETSRAQQVQGTQRFVESIAQKFPEPYRAHARADVIAVLRSKLADGTEPKDITGDAVYAAARKIAIARRQAALGLADDLPAPVPQALHPAAAPKPKPAVPPPPKESPAAGDFLADLLQQGRDARRNR